MWTPNGPKNIHGKPLTGKRTPPRFKVGDRVWSSLGPDDPKPHAGTIIGVPKTSQGRYEVLFDEPPVMSSGRVRGPQSEHEWFLTPMEEGKSAKAGK